MNDELEELLAALDFTPEQKNELRTNPDLALDIFNWAKNAPLRNPAGAIISRFRQGHAPPDPNAWRTTDDELVKTKPDYKALIQAAARLVAHTGHEYLEHDIEAELERLEKHPKVGNGAALTDHDRNRLLTTAAAMREAWEAAQPELEAKAAELGKHIRLENRARHRNLEAAKTT